MKARAHDAAAPVAGPGHCAATAASTLPDAALNSLPAAVIILDGNGRVCDLNPAARGLLGEGLVGCAWREVIARGFDLGGAGDEVRLRDGRWVSVETCPLHDRAGQVLLLIDVSARHALQQRVMRRERLSALGEVSATLAHQIRTPLTAALLYAAQLAERCATAADASGSVQRAQRLADCLRNIESLVRDMLLYVRGEVLDPHPVAVPGLLARLHAALEPELARRAATLEVHPACGSAVLLGSEEALLTALHNLVMNSLEAGARHIEVGCGADALAPGWLHLEVCDDGQGVAVELQEHIFEPFFTTRAGGTGLGLAAVRNVVRAHHGELELQSRPGEGCRVCLRLPAAPAPSVARPDATRRSGAAGGSRATAVAAP